jgi:hypothetical protein
LCDEFDRADVVAAVPERATESVVEKVDLAAAEAARVSDEVSELEGHLVHEAEGAAARGLGEPSIVRSKLRERVGGEVLCAELGLDGIDEIVAERAEIRAANARPEDRTTCQCG